jgi:hypothetical protein
LAWSKRIILVLDDRPSPGYGCPDTLAGFGLRTSAGHPLDAVSSQSSKDERHQRAPEHPISNHAAISGAGLIAEPGPAAALGAGDGLALGLRGRGSAGAHLRLYRNPLRLAVPASLWRSIWSLTACLLTGAVLATAALTVASGAAIFALTLAALTLAALTLAGLTLASLPSLAAAAAASRGCASVEHLRLRQVSTEPVASGYRTITRPGLIAEATGRWRDLAYLLGLWAPLPAHLFRPTSADLPNKPGQP